jgi:exonuclease SbcC
MTLKYDYHITRADESGSVEELRPVNYPRSIDNLSIVEGPNSTGKSTILHLIALGFFGREAPHMNPNLKEKMESFLDLPRTKSTFSVDITLGNGLRLSARKLKPDSDAIDVRETIGGKEERITADTFHNKYYLFYDVPSDPLVRLREILQVVAERQRQYRVRASQFREHLRKVTEAIRASRDPKRIQHLDEETSKLRQDRDKISRKLESARHRLQKLDRYLIAQRFLDIISRTEAKFEQLKVAQASRSNVVRRFKRDDSQYRRVQGQVQGEIDKLMDLHAKIGAAARAILPKKEGNLVRAWDGFDLQSVEANGVLPPALLQAASSLKDSVKAQVTEPIRSRQRQGEFYQQLARFLEQYKEYDVKLPTSALGLKQLIKALNDEALKFKKELAIGQKADDIVADISSLEEQAGALRPHLKELRTLKQQLTGTEATVEPEGIDSEGIDRLDRDYRALQAQLSMIEALAGKREVFQNSLAETIRELGGDPDVRRFEGASEQALEAAVEDLNRIVNTLDETLGRQQTDIEFNERELERLHKVAPHPFQDRLTDVDALLQSATLLVEKLQKEFDAYVLELQKPKPGEPKSELQRAYYNSVGSYVARRLVTIRHGTEFFKVDRVDFVARAFITDRGRQIRFVEMGTGQSQSAYLLAQLSTTDNRRIIALIDEVAMMDDESLGAVYSRLRELDKSGRLVLGLVVQKARTASAIPLPA